MDWFIVAGILAIVAVAVFWIRGKHKVPDLPPTEGVDYANMPNARGVDTKGPFDGGKPPAAGG